jgi:cysteinyl-tRNA synthetase
LIASLFEGVRLIHLIENKKETISETDLTILKDTFHSFFVDVLGLQTAQVSQGSNMQQLNGAVNLLIQLRNEARANKNFALSDQIRDQLAALNIQLKDGKEGTTFSL